MRKLLTFSAAAALAVCASCAYVKANAKAGIAKVDTPTGELVRPTLATEPGSGYYLTFTTLNGQKSPLHAVFEAWNPSQIFPDRVIVRANDQVIEIPIPAKDWQYRAVAGYGDAAIDIPPLWNERTDTALGETHPEAVKAMCSASELSVEIVGLQGKTTINKPVFLEDVKLVCEAYAAK